jgi:hypothetical protein
MVSLVARARIASGLGQSVPGKHEVVVPDKPLYTKAECDSFDGKMFEGGTLCCAEPKKAGGTWYCRRFVPKAGAPGAPGAPGWPSAPSGTILGMQPVTLGIGVAAAAILFALLSRRSAPVAAQAVRA